MKPPVTYMGSKQGIAGLIVERLLAEKPVRIYDLCCGAGSVSLKLADSGWKPADLVMVDAGPWGQFWREIGEGTFDLADLRELCSQVPTDRHQIHDWVKALAARTTEPNSSVFLLLQAAAFGGKPITWAKGYQHNGFSKIEPHWQPKNQYGPLRPMPDELVARVDAIYENPGWRQDTGRWPGDSFAPIPSSIVSRVESVYYCGGSYGKAQPNRNCGPLYPGQDKIVDRVKSYSMRGVVGRCADVTIRNTRFAPGSVVYIDPPYAKTTGYGRAAFDVVALAQKLLALGAQVVFVSEARPLNSDAVLLCAPRKQGSVAGGHSGRPPEYLSTFR